MKQTRNLHSLIGERGVAICTLRPSGFVMIKGEVYDCEGTRPWLIVEGANIIVTGVTMNRFLQVREIGV